MSLVRGGALLRAARLVKHQESGASIVEFALLTPLVFMLVFGMLTGGLAWNSKQNLTHAARDAARHAATLPTQATMSGWLDNVAQRAMESANGELEESIPGQRVCVAYIGSTTSSRVQEGSSVTYGSAPCFSENRPLDGPRLHVEVRRDTDFQAVLYAKTLTLSSQAVARHEVTK